MNIDIVNGIRIIVPTDNMWLYNQKEQIISDKVFLGINANENDWIEITEEEKTNLETQIEEDLIKQDENKEVLNKPNIEITETEENSI